MNMQQIKQEWGTGKSWIDNFTRDFPTLANLADGVALSRQKNAPQVGTVTLANSVRQIPRESVQQVPVLSVEINGTTLSTDAIVGKFLLRKVVFNEDTFGTGILGTMQKAAQTALTNGFVALRANVGKNFNKFSTMLEDIHYNDLVIEPGVFDASNVQYSHVRTRVTKGALEDLIASAKANKNTLWNVPGLEGLLERGATAFNGNQYLSIPRQNAGLGSEETYDFITRYGSGAYYPIEVYSLQQSEDEEPLMKIKSKSKFGYPRVTLLVIDPADLSPFGISRARLASPMKNYGDIYLQSTAKMQLLNADPPVFKRGLFTTQTPLRRGATFESADPNADIRLMEMSNSNLEQFDRVMNYIDQNILATMGVNGVGAPAQNSAYQNSDAVQAQNKTTSLASQQVTSIIENAIRQYALTALDLYISEQTGKTALIVDDEAKDAINRINPPQQVLDPATQQLVLKQFVGDDNVVNVDWEQYYNRIQTWTIKVDLSITPNEMNDKKRADLQDAVTVASQTTDPADPEGMAQKKALTDELMKDIAPEASKAADNAPQMPQSFAPVGGESTPQNQQ